jgi:2-(1,2-epoxy-1,2-dihydrophenyl)acetyl-CoA isomerase
MALRAALIEAIARAEQDPATRAIVLTGAGGHFSAGADIRDMDAADFAAGRDRFRISHRLVRMVIESSKPFIAAVEGWAVGAGFGLALCCDTVVAAENARFMAGFGKIGLVPDFALLHTLPRRIGEGRARQMFLFGEAIAAPEAERIGLADAIAPAGGALEAAVQRAALLAEAAPLPIAMTKSFLARGLAEALEWERNTQSTLFLTADHAEGKAAFLGKRAARFTGI